MRLSAFTVSALTSVAVSVPTVALSITAFVTFAEVALSSAVVTSSARSATLSATLVTVCDKSSIFLSSSFIFEGLALSPPGLKFVFS